MNTWGFYNVDTHLPVKYDLIFISVAAVLLELASYSSAQHMETFPLGNYCQPLKKNAGPCATSLLRHPFDVAWFIPLKSNSLKVKDLWSSNRPNSSWRSEEDDICCWNFSYLVLGRLINCNVNMYLCSKRQLQNLQVYFIRISIYLFKR